MQDSLVMGAASDSIINQSTETSAPAVQEAASIHTVAPGISTSGYTGTDGLLTDWLEMYDYAGGTRFRGFVADGVTGRSMFVFFDQGVLGNDLKPGYVDKASLLLDAMSS